MTFEIREGTIEDATSLFEMIIMGMEEGAFHNRKRTIDEYIDYAFHKREEGFILYVYEVDDDIAGYIDSVTGKRGVGEISGIYVKPNYRRKGVAERLMEKALQQLAKSGCHKARLDVFAENEGAIKFYQRVNFIQEGFLKRDEAERDIIIMSRFLDST